MSHQKTPLIACLIVGTCALLGQVFSLADEPQTRLFSNWFGGGRGSENKRLTDRFLPATLQVLEHTASQVNGSWGGAEAEKKGTRPVYQEIAPLPGLMRLTVLRNSLLAEAKAANLDDFDGFSPAVEEQLQASAKSPLPEQLALVLQRTVEAGELKETSRGGSTGLSQLADDLLKELRDPTTELARVLSRFEALNYAA